MTVEFTGERVIPGEVDVDLWNEHVARYAFACQHAAGRRILDLGSGAGYGSAMLLNSGAASVTSLDISHEALRLTTANSLRVQASASALPLRSEVFDLVVAFEVIEHLQEWRELLTEAARVLSRSGLLVVSTPNKTFYAETRAETGPNPFHEHEFEFEEFASALTGVFSRTLIYLQDRSEAMIFRAIGTHATPALHIEQTEDDVSTANFFIAVCSFSELVPLPEFVYIPRAANAIREKLRHIDRLEGEIEKKDSWLAEAQAAHSELLTKHRDVTLELKRSNEWAASLNDKLTAAGSRIISLQEELSQEQRAARAVVDRYESELAVVHSELEQRTEWALQTTEDLNGRVEELGRCVELLHQTEADLEARTQWAMQLDARREQLERELAEAQAKLSAVQASRWVKLGRAVGVGPELAKA